MDGQGRLPRVSRFGNGSMGHRHILRTVLAFLSFGLGLDWSISERLTLSGAILVTPLVYAVDQDNHYFRLEQFNETLYGAFGVDPSLSLQLSFTERLGALLKLSYRGLWGARGDTVHTEMGNGSLIGIYQNGAGAAYNAVDLASAWYRNSSDK
jgi:outer membrane protease